MLQVWLGCSLDCVTWYRCDIIVTMMVLHVTGVAAFNNDDVTGVAAFNYDGVTCYRCGWVVAMIVLHITGVTSL